MTLQATINKTSLYSESSSNIEILIKGNVTSSESPCEKNENTGFLFQDSFSDTDKLNLQPSLSNEKQSITTWLVSEKTKEMIFDQLYFPLDWETEQIRKPNIISKNIALDVCENLLKSYSLIPKKISPTKEEGIYIRFDYRSGRIKKSLIIEVYNTLEIAAIITNNETKDVEFSFDIEKRQFKNAIESLKKIS